MDRQVKIDLVLHRDVKATLEWVSFACTPFSPDFNSIGTDLAFVMIYFVPIRLLKATIIFLYFNFIATRIRFYLSLAGDFTSDLESSLIVFTFADNYTIIRCDSELRDWLRVQAILEFIGASPRQFLCLNIALNRKITPFIIAFSHYTSLLHNLELSQFKVLYFTDLSLEFTGLRVALLFLQWKSVNTPSRVDQRYSFFIPVKSSLD